MRSCGRPAHAVRQTDRYPDSRRGTLSATRRNEGGSRLKARMTVITVTTWQSLGPTLLRETSAGSGKNVERPDVRACVGVVRGRPRQARAPYRLSRAQIEPLPGLRPVELAYRARHSRMRLLRNRRSACGNLCPRGGGAATAAE